MPDAEPMRPLFPNLAQVILLWNFCMICTRSWMLICIKIKLLLLYVKVCAHQLTKAILARCGVPGQNFQPQKNSCQNRHKNHDLSSKGLQPCPCRYTGSVFRLTYLFTTIAPITKLHFAYHPPSSFFYAMWCTMHGFLLLDPFMIV